MDLGEKGANRAKWADRQRHRSGRGKQKAQGGPGRGGRAQQQGKALETNADRYEEDADDLGRGGDAGRAGSSRSGGADLAELLNAVDANVWSAYGRYRAVVEDVGRAPPLATDGTDPEELSINLDALAASLSALPLSEVLRISPRLLAGMQSSDPADEAISSTSTASVLPHKGNTQHSVPGHAPQPAQAQGTLPSFAQEEPTQSVVACESDASDKVVRELGTAAVANNGRASPQRVEPIASTTGTPSADMVPEARTRDATPHQKPGASDEVDDELDALLAFSKKESSRSGAAETSGDVRSTSTKKTQHKGAHRGQENLEEWLDSL
ncbi:unnamed protein product [Ostreobium quekettii]|uniref:Uncharacterized protein n=1 Tax=Ostreobium quekettii TaxID=121088 RepID=A0A8S1IZP1_9CHLO|nr:unnamed protein product [Ostreobium quekettii]|eukprot:evm.model.scf_422.7 EVM.evm.TU.scf_422.7   scf_422:35315-38144(+)